MFINIVNEYILISTVPAREGPLHIFEKRPLHIGKTPACLFSAFLRFFAFFFFTNITNLFSLPHSVINTIIFILIL
jgi:hypothetical protein